MLNRAALHSSRLCLRPVLVRSPTRPFRAQLSGRYSQIREASNGSEPDWKAREREELAGKSRPSNQPRRIVRASTNETIRPQPVNRASNLRDPIDASEQSPSIQGAVDSVQSNIPHSSRNRPAGDASTISTDYPADADPAQPAQPLPDLTKGIPSTFEAEFNQAARQGQEPKEEQDQAHEATEDKFNITEDPRRPPPGGGGGGGGGGELPRSAYISSGDRRRSAMLKYVYLGLTLGLTSYALYLGRNWDTTGEEEENADAPNGYSPASVYRRIQKRLGSTASYYVDPVSKKLLPDPDPIHKLPYVLVISLNDMMVHSEWTRQSGWKIAKRPGLDYFIQYLSQYYEIIMFTTQPSQFGEQIWFKLDPYGSFLPTPLFREHSLYKDGGYVKDISYINRDIKRVVMMDTDPHHVKHQPENAIVLPKWTGDPKDQTLVQMIPFLEYIATMGVDDVREFLKSFEGKHIPTEFARREKLLREKFEQERAQKTGGGRGGKGIGFGSFLGSSRQPGAVDMSGVGRNGKMLWDEYRELGLRNYEALQQRLREEGPAIIAERKAMGERAREMEMDAAKSNMLGWLGPKQDDKRDQQ